MPRHLIGDAHEWINEIPTVPTHSLAKLQPSQRSWDLYLCVFVSHECIFLNAFYIYLSAQCLVSTTRLCVRATAGQEDPFELDSNLLLSSGRHGEDRKRQCNLFCTTMKHRYLTIWLTYCISIAFFTVLVKNKIYA